LQTLEALSRIDPIFDDWYFIDCHAMCSIPLVKARPRIAALLENNVRRDDGGEPEPERGYHAAAITRESLDPRSLGLRINAGGKCEGDANLQPAGVVTPPDPAIVTYPTFKAAMFAINAIWPPTWANAYAFELHYYDEPLIPGVPLFPYSIFHMPWLSYLSAPLAAGLTLPDEIRTERTPDGGLLMIAVEERLDPINPEHLRRSRILAEIMIARCGGPG
jgi:hypothetical protein